MLYVFAMSRSTMSCRNPRYSEEAKLRVFQAAFGISINYGTLSQSDGEGEGGYNVGDTK